MKTIASVAALVLAWGAYYIDGGQSEKDIRTQLFDVEMTDAEFSARPESGDEYRTAYATTSDVLQAFSIPFTEKGEGTFAPNMIPLGNFKMDILMVPLRLVKSWAGFLVSDETVEPEKFGIIRWAIEKLYIPKAKEQYEQEVAWYGWAITGHSATNSVTAAPGTSTGWERVIGEEDVEQPANGAMDGLWIHILKNLDRMTTIATGAVGTNAETWCTNIESFTADIDAPLRRKIDKIFMSEANYNLYREGRRLKYNINYLSEQDLTAIKNSTIKVAWLRSMDGSDKIWGTPKENRVRPTHTENNGKFDVQPLDRTVKILTNWKKGIGFEVPELVVTNDLENSIPEATMISKYGKAA